MKTLYQISTIFAVMALSLSACAQATPAAPTPDANAIATSAVQTVEARYTLEALQPSATASVEQPSPTPPLAATATPPAAGNYDYKPGCVFATYVADITIPDGMLVTPGLQFTKTWRITNAGSCAWDSRFAMIFIAGDTMGEKTTFPLTQTVYPGQSVDVSVALTAPSLPGTYKSEWRLAVPGGGSAGVGQADANLTLQVEVSDKPKRDFSVTSVVYTITRNPAQSCPASGTIYTITATVTVNGAGEVEYRWDRNPTDDSKPITGKIVFKESGSKTVETTWTLKPGAVQGIDRWVALYVTFPNNQQFSRAFFNWTCP